QFDVVPSAQDLEAYFATLRAFAGKLPAALDHAVADLTGWGEQLDRPARPKEDAEQRGRDRAKFDELKKLVPEIAREIDKRARAIDQHGAAFTEATLKEGHEALLDDI